VPAPQALTPRAKLLLPLLLLALIGVSVHRLVCASPPAAVQEFAGATMGTTYSVKLASPRLPREERAAIARTIQEQLDGVERRMSTYDPESELSRFNAHAAETPFPVSTQTLEVLRVAHAVSERTQGAFDVTVGPLVEAWGFGTGDRPPTAPGAAELARLRAHVGYRQLRIDVDTGTLAKVNPSTACDLSAIAKGYAVGRPWRVAIETPDPATRRMHRAVELLDLSLATSGDYRNFYEQEGVWISHLIDPRTSQPIQHDLASVSVIHPQAVWADAWATALMVLGPDAGYALAKREELAAYLIVRAGEGTYTTRSTPAFEALVGGAHSSD
jgi:thiamine biosynthesis lipoprotein